VIAVFWPGFLPLDGLTLALFLPAGIFKLFLLKLIYNFVILSLSMKYLNLKIFKFEFRNYSEI